MRFLTLFFLLLQFSLYAQVSQNLVTWISFDKPNCEVSDEGNDSSIQVFLQGDSICECGVKGKAMYFGGSDDWFLLFGPKIEQTFNTKDFSLSFYFKSTSNDPQSMALFSKRTDCGSDSAFAIRYNPFSRALNVELTENSTLSGSISKTLPYSCWNHVVLVRKGGTTTLYVNTEDLGSVTTNGSKRANISNNEALVVGDSDCSIENPFRGFMDEIRLYSRALTREEIKTLYFAPDQIDIGGIVNGLKDTTIYLGGSAYPSLTSTCATSILWTPGTGVSNDTIPNPVLSPTVTTTYQVTLKDQFNCVTADSLYIQVVDPATVDCSDILLPTAFTPNSDGLNDTYGISNPFVAGEILAFDIFDRWGNIVFSTIDPLGRWDGSYKGQPVNPGVFLYRIRFRCKGEEGMKSGSVTVIR